MWKEWEKREQVKKLFSFPGEKKRITTFKLAICERDLYFYKGATMIYDFSSRFSTFAVFYFLPSLLVQFVTKAYTFF